MDAVLAVDTTQRASPRRDIGFKQLVALVAALMATNALAIDTMLPALGQIGASLGLAAANERQWVITAYLLGFGAAQLVYGTLADRYGRKPVLAAALAIYIATSLAAALVQSFELLLVVRVIEGLGAAGTRVISVSIVRDRYEGRQMARVMSLAVIVFIAVPALAPSIGQLIMLVAPWRAIFFALALFGAVVLLWMARNLPETLHPQDRRAIDIANIFAAAGTTLRNRTSLGYTLAMTVMMGSMFGFINSAQQIFAEVFRHPRLFSLIFACIAGSIGAASLFNARLVQRLGPRRISHAALVGFIVFGVIHLGVVFGGHESLGSFILLQMAMMFCFGLTMGNFSAMSMEPLGHIAGSAASIQGFISTLAAALIGMVIGQFFNGTVVPLSIGAAVCGVVALSLVAYAERGRLFRAHYALS